MNTKHLFLLILIPAVLLLSGCAGLNGREAAPQPAVEADSTAVEATPNGQETSGQPRQSESTPRPPTPTVAPKAIATPLPPIAGEEDSPVLRSGYLAAASPVYLLPDADSEALGELEAGRTVFVTGLSEDWYEIIYGEARRGHAWLPQAAVDFASPTATPRASRTVSTSDQAVVQVGATRATASGETSSTPKAPAATTDLPGGTVLASKLNVRKGPATNRAILGQLRRGDRVEIADRREGWLQIVYPAGEDGRAWVSASYVAVDGEPTPEPPAVTAASGLPGRIVFQTFNGGDLYIMNANGTGLRLLTRGGFEPALSPDGNQVAFTRQSDPQGLYVMNLDGSNERRLLGGNQLRSPSWTPDGSGIVISRVTKIINCRSTPFGCVSDSEIRSQIGGDCADIPGVGRVCVSDFRLITDSLTGLTLVNVADGSSRDLPASERASAPFHSLTDSRVLFLDRDGLATTRTDSNEPPQRIVELPAMLGAAVFTPDSRYIYASRRSGDNWNVWRWQADGGGEFALTQPPALRQAPVHSVSPAVSPDGKSLAFLTNRTGKWELWVMNADGSNQRPLAPAALAQIDFRYDFASERMLNWTR